MSSGNRFDISIGAITTDLKKGLADARAELNKFKKDTESTDWKSVLNAEKVALAQSRTEAQAYRTEAAKLTLEKRKGKTATDAAVGSYDEAQRRLTALGRSIKQSSEGFSSNGVAVRKQIAEYNELNTKLKQFDATMGNNQRNVGNYSSGILSSIPILGQFAGAAGAASLGMMALQKSFSTNLALDSLTTALRNVSTDTANFETNMKFLRETTDRLGLDFITTANAFKQWQGAAKFSNITGDESRRIFESIANAGAKMKLSSDQMQGALLAVTQMMSKGKVQAEELRGQLGERLPGAFALAAKSMGVTEFELNKMLEKGEVIANDFLPKFASQLDKAFDNDKTKKVESLQASVSRLGNEFDNLWQSERATSFFTATSDGFATLLKDVNNLMNSNSMKGFLASLLSIGGSNDITSGYMRSIASTERTLSNSNRVQATPTSRAIERGVKGFSDFDVSKQALEIEKQKEIVTKRAEEYKLNSNKRNLEMLTIQNGVLAEMNKIYYNQEKAVKNIVSTNEKASGKTQADIIKEANEALKGAQTDNLRGIDKELVKIDTKWDKILEKINEIKNIDLRKSLALDVESGRNLDKMLARIDAFAKSSNLKGLTGKNSGISLSGSLSSLPSLEGLLNSKAGYSALNVKSLQLGDKNLERRLSRVVESGFRQGISGILDNITELGNNFQDIFTNIFGEIASSMRNIFNNVLGTYLGDSLKNKLQDLDIGGLGNKISTALVAGVSTAGNVISGATKKTSTLGQGLGGALTGASAGIAFGPWGAAIGGVIGAISGIFGSKKAKKEEELQKQQLEEQKKQTALMERQALLAYSSSVIGQMTNQGVVTEVDRDAFGNLAVDIKGSTLQLVLDRAKSERGN